MVNLKTTEVIHIKRDGKFLRIKSKRTFFSIFAITKNNKKVSKKSKKFRIDNLIYVVCKISCFIAASTKRYGGQLFDS